MLMVLALVAGWPLLRTIWFALHRRQPRPTSTQREFIGFVNFNYLLTDPDWWNAVWNTVVFAADLGDHRDRSWASASRWRSTRTSRGRGLLRAAVLIPWAIPTVVSAQMWGWMFHDVFGVINDDPAWRSG